MDLSFYKTLLEVAKWQNYTKAADMLGYAQSSVTSQIQKLETEYGVQLFERIGKKMRPTPAGEELLRYASQLIKIYEESKVTISGQTSGSFTIGTFETTLAAYMLPSYLGAFKKMYPQMNIILNEVAEHDLLRAIKAGECDLGFMVDRLGHDADLQFETVRQEEFVLIAEAGHPLSKKKVVLPEDLHGEPFIMTNSICMSRQLLESMLRTHLVQYQLTYQITNHEAIKKCVTHGLGLALVPRTVINEEQKNGQLAVLPLRYPDLKLYIQLVYHKKKYISKPMRAFIDSLCSLTPLVPLAAELTSKVRQL
jgi:DNA-binding transcriptional LysR family regulator